MLRFATLIVAQAFDFATFHRMVGTWGVAAEANPLVQGLFLSFGTPAVVIAKVALVTLIISLGVAAAVRGGKGRWAAVGGLGSVPVVTGPPPSGVAGLAWSRRLPARRRLCVRHRTSQCGHHPSTRGRQS